MNFFSSRDFLDAVAQSMFAGVPSAVETVEVDGRQFDTLYVRGRCQENLPFCDFLEPRAERVAKPKRHGFLPAVYQRTVGVGDYTPESLPGFGVAPYTDFSGFQSFEEFVKYASKRSSRAFEAQKRKRRKLEREVGETRVVLRAPVSDMHLVDLCMRWKSAQYQRSNYVDMFSSPKLQQLFRSLFERGAIAVSVLYAGDRPTAIHLGPATPQRFYYWVPSYDIELQGYSPGVVLMEELMRDSMQNGVREFDFLIGAEEYKFYYATHVRLIGQCGERPLHVRLWQRTRPFLMEQVRRNQNLYGLAQQLKRRWLERRL
ncbi:MAG: GNAT family N-acetyltransferase [Polyangiaceae bacterium]